MSSQLPERLISFRDVSVRSTCTFGTSVGAIIVGVALWPLVRHHGPVRLWLLACGVILLVCAIAMPDLLPLNRLWFRFDLLLAKITKPIVMGVMLVLMAVPFSRLRPRGHDLLRLRRDASVHRYWIERDRAVPTSLSKQF